MVNDAYQSGQLVSQSDGSGTLLATFTYDVNGTPSSVQVGSDLTSAPRYSYSYNGHGDVVALTDAGGTTVATYSYDTFGTPTIWESFTTRWHNPYLYDGRDGARYDSETGLSWLRVRAYDPALGRFLSRDPLGRAPLFFDASQPYVYGGNNPLTNVDPSGQWFRREMMDGGDWMPRPAAKSASRRVQAHPARRAPAQKKQSSHTSPPKPGRPNIYAQVMGICNRLPGGICNTIKSKLSSMSENDWGNVLRIVGWALTAIGAVLYLVDIFYTFKTQFDKSRGFKLAIEVAGFIGSFLGSLTNIPGVKSSIVQGILAALYGALPAFSSIYA